MKQLNDRPGSYHTGEVCQDRQREHTADASVPRVRSNDTAPTRGFACQELHRGERQPQPQRKS